MDTDEKYIRSEKSCFEHLIQSIAINSMELRDQFM